MIEHLAIGRSVSDLGKKNINILRPWPGNSPDLNPIKILWSILKRQVETVKPTNSDKLQALIMQEWAAIRIWPSS